MKQNETVRLPWLLDDVPLMGFRSDMHRFLGVDERPPWQPAIDLFDDGERLVLLAELAGLSRGEVGVRVHERTLEIRGCRGKPDIRYEDVAACHRERPDGRFHRAVALPAAVDAQRVETRLERGVLTIILPKTQSASTKGDHH